jgi:hypothetical protein
MNEKIKELAIAAKLEHCVSHVRLQDFAERIIKECASQVRFTDLLLCNDDSDGEILWQAYVQLKQHFGIELQSYKVICDRTNNP